jgi:hypothetical protein
MSTDSNRNPRGVRIRQRNAAGEIIPEPAFTGQGEVGPTALFAQTFSTIATGLQSLPEDLVHAVRELPERSFPPPWVFWLLVHVIRHVANHRRAWEFVRANCPVRCSHVERRGWQTEPATIENDEFYCAFQVALSQATVAVYRRDTHDFVRIPLRIEAISASEVDLHAWQDFVPLSPRAIAWDDDDERFDDDERDGMAGARLQEFVPAASGEELLDDLRAMQLVLGDEDALMAVRDYDQVVLDLCRRLENPQWRPWLAALAGDWFLLEDLATATNNQELLAEARRRTALFIRTWLTDPKHTIADWGFFQDCPDWRAYCLRMIHRRGSDYFRAQIQPYLRDLRWIADWGDALPPFCDASWQPDLLRIIERLLNTRRDDVALVCIEHLLYSGADAGAVMQTIRDVGILDAGRWEDLAFLMMAHAPQLSLPAIENALSGGPCPALMPFLAVVDTEWSRSVLQRQLEDSRQRDPVQRLRLLTALSESEQAEVARAAKRSVSEMGRLSGRRREQSAFRDRVYAIRRRVQRYRTAPSDAAEGLLGSLSIYRLAGGDWELGAASAGRLLERIVTSRLSEVAEAAVTGVGHIA